MAVEDDPREVSSSSVVLKSQHSAEKGEVLSPEDMAWVDSCLIKEPEISDRNWNSMKDALLEILTSQPGLYDYSASVSNGSSKENDVQMLTSMESTEADQFLDMEAENEEFPRTPDDLLSITEEAESSSDNFSIKDLHSLAFVGNPFLPSYIDSLKETQILELETNLSSSVEDKEPSTDIFRVWDLNTPAEENELDKQLNKILEESDLQLKPSTFDVSGSQKDLKDESVDDVIAAIADIALDQNSS